MLASPLRELPGRNHYAMNMHFLGPAGTFSEAATRALIKHFALKDKLSLVPCASIGSTVDATARDGGFGVVPYYNLIDGLVQESLDRVLGTSLHIHGALQLPIHIALGGAATAPDDAPVYSHPKALAQCSDYLDEHHPQRARLAVSSTAAGVDEAMASNALGLAGVDSFASRGVPVLVDDATNRYFGRQNYTEFLLIGAPEAGDLIAHEPDRCVLACAPQTDRPGLLADILGLLSLFDINLARLHSRPAIQAAPTQLDPQVFYFEIAGTVADDDMRMCTEALARTLGGDKRRDVLSFMGAYPLVQVPGTELPSTPS